MNKTLEIRGKLEWLERSEEDWDVSTDQEGHTKKIVMQISGKENSRRWQD